MRGWLKDCGSVATVTQNNRYDRQRLGLAPPPRIWPVRSTISDPVVAMERMGILAR